MRVYTLSDDTLLLKMWDDLFTQAQSVSPASLEDDYRVDISGNWIRAKRAMECRNPNEAPGLQSDSNPNGSRSEVNPPDVDRTASKLAGHDIAKPLPWLIAKAETAGDFTGSGDGSAHGHDSFIAYKGKVKTKINGEEKHRHQFNYMTTRSAKRTYKYQATRAVMSIVNKMLKREMVSTVMHGVIIVDQDRKGKVTQLTSVVTYCDGKDADLPKRFREISVWKKAGPSAVPN